MELTEELKRMALEAGFKDVGITTPEAMRDLHYGWVEKIRELKPPEEILPGTRSVIMLVLHGWDRAFSLQINSPNWKGYGIHPPSERVEGYYATYQICQNMAWPIVSHLRERGHGAVFSTNVPMKTTAIKCGLGCQGKNTLFVHPEIGPKAMLMAILTTAELEADEPFEGDLCEGCDVCIRACPSKALSPYSVEINRCVAYAAENPGATDIPEDVRELEKKLIVRPTENSFIECTTCIDACPLSKPWSQ